MLPVHPKEYLKQGLSHCGAYSVKGILSAYGKDHERHPRDYHTHWINRFTGSGLSSKLYYVRMLQSYGFNACGESGDELSDGGRLTLLKTLLAGNAPVMLMIGNGYTPGGEYKPWMAKFISHWITVWGYDDEQQVFYLYDSCVQNALYDKDIPIGNKMRTYKQILRDWRGSVTTSRLLGWGEYYYVHLTHEKCPSLA